MRRLLALLALTGAVAAMVVLGGGAGGTDPDVRRYTVELDNAFGLIEGADVKVAGVRAGKITSLDLDTSDMRAVVGIEVRRAGFGDLRADVFCETRPQSLIGEYFIDCRPGTSKRRLPDGARIPVERTGSTVPPDLVANIMRRPYRERLTIIYNELGAGLAARGGDLNETIRRANPALREVDRVLAILREQRRTIRDLYADADRVVGALAREKEDVSRFVREARDTARVSAERTAQVRRNFRLLPRFLAELQPTIRLLGESAEAQEGALRNLDGNRVLLKRFLDRLGPFAEASRPAVRTLGEAARAGRPAVRATMPRLAELEDLTRPLPEAAQNLAITLEHLDDPRFAVEKDPRSPRGGSGYTGLEAFLRYIFAQSQAINLVDGDNYILKVAAFLDNTCARYLDADDAKDPQYDRCAAILGPRRPGINEADPTRTAEQRRARARERRGGARRRGDRPASGTPQAATPAPEPSRDGDARPSSPAPSSPLLPDLPAPVTEALEKVLPGRAPDAGDALPRGAEGVLDFLLGP